MAYPIDIKVVPPVWVESGGKYKKLYQDAEVQISLLNGEVSQLQQQEAALQQQLQQAEAELQQAEAELAIAEAQIVQDAATIASLQAQVASLQQQVADLQAQLAGAGELGLRFIFTQVTRDGGGIYIPPTFPDAIINVSALQPEALMIQITRTGGGYP